MRRCVSVWKMPWLVILKTLNQKPKELKPVAEYFRLQRRFKGVPAETLDAVEAEIRTEFTKLEQEAER